MPSDTTTQVQRSAATLETAELDELTLLESLVEGAGGDEELAEGRGNAAALEEKLTAELTDTEIVSGWCGGEERRDVLRQ